MKGLVSNLLAAAVAVVASMPVQPATAASNTPCDNHGGLGSAVARPVGHRVDVTVECADGVRRGPFRFHTSGAPCGDHGGVRAATARPGAGVIEVIIYCNDGQSEGPYTYEIR